LSHLSHIPTARVGCGITCHLNALTAAAQFSLVTQRFASVLFFTIRAIDLDLTFPYTDNPAAPMVCRSIKLAGHLHESPGFVF
jgi:hypothetical protein